ncbi:hypothetical protein HK101_002315 [Irineochytrium annulatum]|nr:hypothetical protein HK101_002315 [Irineochytrium annulatum]
MNHRRAVLVLLLALLGLVLNSAVVVAEADEVPVADVPKGYEPITVPTTGGNTFKFESENSRVLNIVINSLYKSKEIFLRELISNAADALDKIRFLSLTNPKVLDSNKDLEIKLLADKERKLLVLTDTGVGMTSKDLQKNLGTIAKSGTSEFLTNMERNKTDLNFIGQFGVGFYSVFLVCDRVTVASKHNDEAHQYVWESTSENEFTISKDPRGNTLGRGTEITLHLKDDALEYLEDSTLSNLIRKYSEFINFPIYMWRKKTTTEEVIDEDADAVDMDKSGDDEEDVEDVDPAEEKKPKMKTVTHTTYDWSVMNENKPIWTRPASSVTDDEYKEFYKSFTKDYQDPLAWVQFKAEGDVDFKSILYVPSKAPPKFLQTADALYKNIKLFVRRVFITDEMEDFFPRWLSFIKGLVDSDDLPLNVSRETLQKHGLLKMIKKKLVAKAVDMITNLSKDPVKYKTFLKEYGIALKLGVIEDAKLKPKLLKLLRFKSSFSDDEETSLDDYVKRMKGKQPQIYFVTGSSLDEIRSSPVIEVPIARGYEVLYFDEPLDEYLVQQVTDYEGKKLQSLGKSGVLFGDEDKRKEEEEELGEKFKDFNDWLKEQLEDSVEKVVVSTRLTKSPTAIVANEYGISGNMERIMAAQALQTGEDFMRTYYAKMKKVLEINPKHPLILAMKKKVEGKQVDDLLKDQVRVLYETTLLRSGFDLKSTPEFAARVESILRRSLKVNLDAQADVKVEPAPERGEEDEEDMKVGKKAAEDDEADEVVHDEL